MRYLNIALLAVALVCCGCNAESTEETPETSNSVQKLQKDHSSEEDPPGPKKQAMKCKPDTLRGGGKLEIVADAPYARQLAIITPGQTYFLMDPSPYATSAFREASLEQSNPKARRYEIPIDSLRVRPKVYGVEEESLVFVSTGRYEIKLGRNLETGSGVYVYKCSVYFVDSAE